MVSEYADLPRLLRSLVALFARRQKDLGYTRGIQGVERVIRLAGSSNLISLPVELTALAPRWNHSPQSRRFPPHRPWTS
jgi:hypothetical protein